jgi:hypothetical protein
VSAIGSIAWSTETAQGPVAAIVSSAWSRSFITLPRNSGTLGIQPTMICAYSRALSLSVM